MAIQWRLAVMMAERNLNNKDLIKLTGFHAVTISKLKTTRAMPSRLEYVTLNKLCNALQCQPGDLLSFVPEEAVATELGYSSRVANHR